MLEALHDKLDQILDYLTRKDNDMSAELEALKNAVAALSAPVSTVVTELAAHKAAAVDPAELTALAASVTHATETLTAAVAPAPVAPSA